MTRRVWWATALTALVAVALGASVALAGAPAVAPVRLPADHGAHPAANVEWWYTAGTLRGSDGHRYFWFATAWSAHEGVVSRVKLVDLSTGRTVLSHQDLTATALRAGAQTVPVGPFTLARHAGGRWGTWSVAQAGSLALTLTPQAPYVLHGRRGVITQGPGGRSDYYSEPRLAARGSVRLGGRTITLRGLGWLDHQWGDFATRPGALRWNWFACQLADGRDLMLYEFLTPQGRPSGIQAGTLVGAHGRVSHLQTFTVTPLAPALRPPGAALAYWQRWRLRVAGLTLTLRSLTRDGYVAMQILPSFWEAPAAITSGPAGACIVEVSRNA